MKLSILVLKLSVMVNGFIFTPELHPNHKTIYVGDWNSEKSVPTIEDLEPWLQISDIELFTNGNCPFVKNMKKEQIIAIAPRAFSLQLQGGENTSLDLIAPDQQTYNYWEDGIKCLKNMEMSSTDYGDELKVLLDMEVKLRLLDLEGVDLPATAPMVGYSSEPPACSKRVKGLIQEG